MRRTNTNGSKAGREIAVATSPPVDDAVVRSRQAHRQCLHADRLVIGIGVHPGKTPMFSVEEKIALLKAECAAVARATACEFLPVTFAGLTIDAARTHKATSIFRGLRDGTDLDYEMQMAGMNGAMAPDVRTALADAQQRVVGVVYNAVDDHLKGSDQLHQRWALDQLRLLPSLLREAREARRVVVVTADHGHVLDDGTRALPHGVGDRWRGPGQPATDDEVVLRGPRVLNPEGGQQVVCLWGERTRYANRRNGYHGGVAPQELVVPLSVFVPAGTLLDRKSVV